MSTSIPLSISALLRPYMKLSAKTERFIDQHSTHTVIPKGKLALHKGDQIAGAYIVVKGQLRVFCYAARGTEATLYTINPGETCVFALNSLFNNLRYPAWVGADVQTELLFIEGSAYKTLFREEPDIQDLTVHALSAVVYRLMQEMEQMQGWTLKQRLANFLLNSASSDGVVERTQQQISNHLGTSREVTARLLGDLSSRNLVSTGRGRIKLKNFRSLGDLLKN